VAGVRVRILQVVHGFPPFDNAGTERSTFDLCRELIRRGHTVGVFFRADPGNEADFLEGGHPAKLSSYGTSNLTAYVHYRSIDEDWIRQHPRQFRLSYWDESVESAFRSVLDDFRPEVVHFQHLIRLSASLLPIARGNWYRAVILTLRDYWFLCPKIKLIRSMPEPMPKYPVRFEKGRQFYRTNEDQDAPELDLCLATVPTVCPAWPLKQGTTSGRLLNCYGGLLPPCLACSPVRDRRGTP
jgi:hypothetical protein